jgi:hypothetical protein
MAVEKINLNISSISRFRDKYKKALIIAAIFSAIMAILDGKSLISSFIFGFIFLSLIFCGMVASYNLFCLRFGLGFVKKNQEKIELALKEKGFQVDYAGKGILVDNQKKRIAFLQSTGSEVILCNYSDIRSWRVGSIQETSYHGQYNSVTNTMNLKENTKTHMINIIVTLASPDYPQVQFVAGTNVEADQWISRLSALINN